MENLDGFFVAEYLESNSLMMYEMVKDNPEYIRNHVMRKLIHQAQKEALMKCLKNRLHLYFEEYLDSEEFLKNNPIFKEVKDKAEKLNTRYIFLTVNPEPSITLKMFRDVIDKAISKKWMNNYIYVIEQRGDNIENIGKGFHCHFIIDTDGKKRHEIIRELKNTFKRVCDISHNSIFNIRNIKEEHLMRFIKYITGQKHQSFKHIKQQIDKTFRDDNNISLYYGKGELVNLVEANEDIEEHFDYNF